MKYLLFIFIGVVSYAQNIQVAPLKLSNGAMDIAPVFYKDGIVYSSNQKNTILKNYVDKDDQYLFDLYFAYRRDTSRSYKSKPFSTSLNTSYHEGPCSFSSDYKTILVTRDIFTKENKKKTIGIFISEERNGLWSEYKPFEYNSVKYNLAHPAISSDGNTLYFTSDMKGGSGGKDLWKSTKKNGKWTKPVNLGKQVNSSKDEIFPTLNEYDELYFSSNRKGGYGGYDLYKALQTAEETIINRLGKPFNSKFNDYGMVTRQSESTGFFTSDRLNDRDQIFAFDLVYPTFKDCNPSKQPKLCYTVSEETPVSDSLPLKLRWRFSDGTELFGAKVTHCFADIGSYKIELDLIDTVTAITYETVGSYDLDIEQSDFPPVVIADTVQQKDEIFLKVDEYFIDNKSEYLWYFDDEKAVKGTDAIAKFHGVGQHRIYLGTINGQKCVYKDVVVLPSFNTSEKVETFELVFSPNQSALLPIQLEALEKFRDNLSPSTRFNISVIGESNLEKVEKLVLNQLVKLGFNEEKIDFKQTKNKSITHFSMNRVFIQINSL